MYRKSFFITSFLCAMFGATNSYGIEISLDPSNYGDVIRLSDTNDNQNVLSTRISPQSLYVEISNLDPKDLNFPNINTALIESITPKQSGFIINLANPSFGFIQSKNPDGDFLINLYSDSLGSRWTSTPQSLELLEELAAEDQFIAQDDIENDSQINIAEQNDIAEQINIAEQNNIPEQNNFQPEQNALNQNNQNNITPEINSQAQNSKPQDFQPQDFQPQNFENNQNTGNLGEFNNDLSNAQNLNPIDNNLVGQANNQNNGSQQFGNQSAGQINNGQNINNQNQKNNNQNQISDLNNLNKNTNDNLNNSNISDNTTNSNLNNQNQISDLNNLNNNSQSTTENFDSNNENVITDSSINDDLADEGGRTSFSFSLSENTSNESKPLTEKEVIEFTQENEFFDEENDENEEIASNAEESSEQASSENGEGIPKPEGQIVYVDEEGNVLPPPLDIPQTIANLKEAAKNGHQNEVLKNANLLREESLPLEILEEVLSLRLRALYGLNSVNLKEKGDEVVNAAQELINANPSYHAMPEIYEILVSTYLALNREDEAEAFVKRLFELYPSEKQTPASLLILANHYLEMGEYALASNYLEKVINNYPDDDFSQTAALLQTKALFKQGDLQRTKAFIDFMDRRWSRLYLKDPEYFTIRADVEKELKDYKAAIETYWLMYNVDPKGEQADFALNNIAQLYFMEDDVESAHKVLDTLIADFPDSKYRPSALLFKAENGYYSNIDNLDSILAMYEKPNPVLPSIYYNQLIKEHPGSQEAIDAELRLAVEALWNKDYKLAADRAKDYYSKYITFKDADIALEVLHKAVEPLFQLSMDENNYEQTLSLWEQYPQIHELYQPYSPELRMAFARGYLNRRNIPAAEEILETFLTGDPKNQDEFNNGLYAYSIMLSNALSSQNWNRVLDVTAKVDGWDLPKDIGLQRLYSIALAAENLGLPARSLPIWQALAPNEEVPLYQRAYAQYFLARDAERRQNLRESYQANLDALAMFEDLKNQQSPFADDERIRESIAALMDITEIAGRYAESLEWINRYREFVPPTSSDYAGVQLREARVNKKMGDNETWRAILEEVKGREPDSIFGKMAESELKAFDIARDINRFTGQN